jgi:hypothetical protein
VGLFDFDDGAFDDHMVDPLVVISLLSLIAKVGVGASGDGENCVMGRKVVILLHRLTDL